MSAHSQKQSNVDAQSSHVCSGLAGNPEHSQTFLRVVFQKFTLIDGPNTELSLDS